MTSHDERTGMIVAEFRKQFDAEPTVVTIGPGRVNLIGEHTDYNDGFVLPVAIKRDVRLAIGPRTDGQVRIFSLEYDDWGGFDTSAIAFQKEKLWINYVQGVADVLKQRGVALVGFDAVLSGNVPRASGLSSSAALEVATAKAFLVLADALDRIDGAALARAAQQAENEFVGVNCGIMDQFISVLGAKSHALLIDCRSLDYKLVPFPANASLVIGNTKASRSLAGSAYNERRAQCEAGVAVLQSVMPGIAALRDVNSSQLAAHEDLLDAVVYRRCRHVVSENERVMQTVDALQRDDLVAVGLLMNASHASLRDDYEVSSDALDAMVDAMQGADGCYGARLTGAGFGGCAIALVKPGSEQTVADAIYHHYPKVTNIWPDVYTSPAADGARVIVL